MSKPRINFYMTGYDTCKIEVDEVERASTLITAAMEHDAKIAAMIFQGVATYMRIHNLQPSLIEELLAEL